jgi:hypothetical protein
VASIRQLLRRLKTQVDETKNQFKTTRWSNAKWHGQHKVRAASAWLGRDQADTDVVNWLHRCESVDNTSRIPVLLATTGAGMGKTRFLIELVDLVRRRLPASHVIGVYSCALQNGPGSDGGDSLADHDSLAWVMQHVQIFLSLCLLARGVLGVSVSKLNDLITLPSDPNAAFWMDMKKDDTLERVLLLVMESAPASTSSSASSSFSTTVSSSSSSSSPSLPSPKRVVVVGIDEFPEYPQQFGTALLMTLNILIPKFLEDHETLIIPCGAGTVPAAVATGATEHGKHHVQLAGLDSNSALTLLGLEQISGRYLKCFVEDIGGLPRLLRELEAVAGNAKKKYTIQGDDFDNIAVGALWTATQAKIASPPEALLHFALAGVLLPDVLLPKASKELTRAKAKLKQVAPNVDVGDVARDLQLGHVPYNWDAAAKAYRVQPSIAHLVSLVETPNFAALRPAVKMPFLSSSIHGGTFFEFCTMGCAVTRLNALYLLGQQRVRVCDWLLGALGPKHVLEWILQIPPNCQMGFEQPWLFKDSSTSGTSLENLGSKGGGKPVFRELRRSLLPAKEKAEVEGKFEDSTGHDRSNLVAEFGATWKASTADEMSEYAKTLFSSDSDSSSLNESEGEGMPEELCAFRPGLGTVPLAKNHPDIDWRLLLQSIQKLEILFLFQNKQKTTDRNTPVSVGDLKYVSALAAAIQATLAGNVRVIAVWVSMKQVTPRVTNWVKSESNKNLLLLCAPGLTKFNGMFAHRWTLGQSIEDENEHDDAGEDDDNRAAAMQKQLNERARADRSAKRHKT